MNNILSVIKELNKYSVDISKEELFDSFVNERLIKLLNTYNEELDERISNLINYSIVNNRRLKRLYKNL